MSDDKVANPRGPPAPDEVLLRRWQRMVRAAHERGARLPVRSFEQFCEDERASNTGDFGLITCGTPY